jgi:hypothetical protein
MVWDSAQWGLALRMEPTGHAAWKVVSPFGGRPRWFHIGSAAAIGLADARKLASRIMYQVAEGKDPCAERKAERGKGTFEELALRYGTVPIHHRLSGVRNGEDLSSFRNSCSAWW